MSIEINYPLIDRSDYTPHKQKKDEDDHVDLNNWDQIFSDGRPYRAESWAAYQITFITYYFSVIDIEKYSNQELKDYLIDEGVIKFDDELYHQMGFEGLNCSVGETKDKQGNLFWKVTIIIGDEDGIYARDSEKPKWLIRSKPQEFRTERGILYSYINDIYIDLTNQVMLHFQNVKSKRANNKIPLENLWEEYCVQVHTEEFTSWIRLEKQFKEFIWALITPLNENLKKLMWFWLEDNLGEENDMDYYEDDLVDQIFNHNLPKLAWDYTNGRIENYIYS
jgi:hypothetical protein